MMFEYCLEIFDICLVVLLLVGMIFGMFEAFDGIFTNKRFRVKLG